MQKIVPFLWFDNNLEEAIAFYTSVFKDSSVKDMMYNTKSAPGEEGAALAATFILNGVEFACLNGGPQFKFNESVSFYVKCDTQDEIDYYWDTLTADGGEESACGWLKDKFGLSWQITPPILMECLRDPDREKADRVMQAMMKMGKIIIKDIEAAAKG
jgi:predicted 3-demethylubiquinone-9 3-methyltransferase (glyoxalase superfamily)